MYSSRLRAALWATAWVLCLLLPAACGSDSKTAGKAPSGSKGTPSRNGPLFRDGTLYLMVDFERREFDLLQGSVPLWTLPFATSDSGEVADWVEAFKSDPQKEATPLSENILLSSRSQLSDSVMAIVAEASGFDPALMQRQYPARFILRWEDAALDIETPAHGSSGGFGEWWQDARNTAHRLFGEEQLKVQIDSVGALTLQRAARPPILTIVRPPRKR
jgi:hypothetical protein